MEFSSVAPHHDALDRRLPSRQTAPVVVASPHSGSVYPASFLRLTAVPLAALRRAEDAFVDDLFAAAPGLGMPFLAARFPRSYVDANREPYELDPGMFEGPLPQPLNHRTTRVAAGLGMIPRSEEHTSELQSQFHLVCRLLLEKKKKTQSKSPPEAQNNIKRT